MNRREFVVAALALVGAWLTGRRVRWHVVFAERERVAVQMHTRPDTFNEGYRKIQGKLLQAFRGVQAEWDDFLTTQFA
jgi:hypothetical protein